MTTKHSTTPAATVSAPSAWDKLVAGVKDVFGFSGRGADTSEIWELYRMSRGSDSLRPALVRKLAANAAR
ncbi:hypothetical protein [Massilia sp. GCM10023247]|uniref:hypothetical protein n=1 Tax=Massilia sp. GCM10023247 TaxID=3252643 RepID=UPI00361CBAA8